jgi:hypothetical protein
MLGLDVGGVRVGAGGRRGGADTIYHVTTLWDSCKMHVSCLLGHGKGLGKLVNRVGMELMAIGGERGPLYAPS